MEFNWSTFALEILNFLVLVWLLKHFLYKPVMNIIQQRQNEINEQLSQAEAKENNAKALEASYQNRLSDWESEKQQKLKQLQESITSERERLMAEVHKAIDQEREKAKAVDQRQQQDFKRQTEKAAYDQVSTFATRLLSRLASPELENRIAAMVLDDLSHLPQAQSQALQTACTETGRPIKISSAYPLDAELKQRFESAIGRLQKTPKAPEFQQIAELVSGIRIAIGDWRLEASLADELRYFTQQSHYETR